MYSPDYARARGLALVALFAALTVALGVVIIVLPISPVPITGQTLGVMLAGAMLGARAGFMSQALVVALCAAGLPVLAGGRGGLGVLLGPTGGYIVAWPLGAFLIGWLVERLPRGRAELPLLVAANLVGGVGLVYLLGVPWLAYLTGRSLAEALAVGAITFLPGDLLKVAIASLAARALWATYDPRAARAVRQRSRGRGQRMGRTARRP